MDNKTANLDGVSRHNHTLLTSSPAERGRMVYDQGCRV